MKAGDVIGLLKQSATEWAEDKASTLGAALAYYTAFSLAPLLILPIGIAGLALGEEAARGQILEQMRGLVGEQGGKAVEGMIQSASKPSQGILATIVGVVTLLFGASGVFGQFQASLNAIWGVEPKTGRGVAGILKDRFLSFGMILVIGFLLLVSLVLTAGLAAAGKWVGNLMPGTEAIGHLVNFVVSFGVITLLFAMIFKVLPDVKMSWSDVWLGAGVTALLFTIGKFALGVYLGKSATESSPGAAGSLIVLLLWVYYSAQIVFFGAEFTQIYVNRFGSHVEPADDAARISKTAGQASATTPA
ncbi:MAG: rane protein [Chthoniobacter sp.]|jgi:membrane protein|nr:rane protein [Chthoniobacter sp.]